MCKWPVDVYACEAGNQNSFAMWEHIAVLPEEALRFNVSTRKKAFESKARHLQMYPFTWKGGFISKFHAMAIFTVLTVKWRKIIGMWVKFLQHTMNAPWNISRCEKGHTLWSLWKGHRCCEMFHAVKKGIVSVKYSTVRENSVLTHYVNITLLPWMLLYYQITLLTVAHFSDLLQALKLESHYYSKSIQSVPKIRCWWLHRRLLLRFPTNETSNFSLFLLCL